MSKYCSCLFRTMRLSNHACSGGRSLCNLFYSLSSIIECWSIASKQQLGKKKKKKSSWWDSKHWPLVDNEAYSLQIKGLHSSEEAFFLPTQQPLVQIPAPLWFFTLLLSWWTVFRLKPSSVKQWILQMQLAVTSRAKKCSLQLSYSFQTKISPFQKKEVRCE